VQNYKNNSKTTTTTTAAAANNNNKLAESVLECHGGLWDVLQPFQEPQHDC
jgi:hypothetical protein